MQGWAGLAQARAGPTPSLFRVCETTPLTNSVPRGSASRSSRRTGGPYLARFSRDVGWHCTVPLTLASTDALRGQHRWYPTSREKRARYGAPAFREGTRTAVLFLFGSARASN